ncbi:MAG: peptide ABC transporter substrate-binding protein [Anaerolineae bacterium]
MQRRRIVLAFGRFLILVLLVVLLPGCGQQEVATPTPSPGRPTATASPLPSATPKPSDTPVPTPTPGPTDTPVPTPTPEPSPTPRPSPTPEGYYSAPDDGWSIRFPSDWEVEQSEDSMPALMAEAPGSEIMAVLGWNYFGGEESLAELMAELPMVLGAEEVEQPVGEPEEIALGDGTPAYRVTITLTEQPEIVAQVVMAQRGARVYMVIFASNGRTLARRARTLEAVVETLTLTTPRAYDVDRTRALVLSGIEPYDMDPATTEDNAEDYVGHLFRGLVVLDTNLQVVPDLAERWELSEDGRTYTFYLHEEAVFHDGRPVTAADVKYSWERAASPEVGSTKTSTYLGDVVGVQEMLDGQADEISGVTVLDDHTLQVTIDEPKVYFLAKLTWPVAFVVDRENVEAGGEDWWHEPNGTGPFRLETWDDDVMIFTRNDDFYGPLPWLEHVVYLIDAGPSSMLYENGEIDIAGVSSSLVERVRDPDDPLHDELHVAARLCTYRVVLDHTRPPFDDPLVRQAFSHAVDREMLAEVIAKGMVQPAVGPLPPGMPGYSGDLTVYGFDVAQAQALMAQSSYGDAANLPPLTFTDGGYQEPGSDVTAMVEQWEETFGIEIEVELLDPMSYVEEIKDHHGHMFTMGWCADYPDPQNFLDVLYHSQSEENLGHYASAEVDALLEQARTERDPEARLALYHQAEEMIVADAAAIWLSHATGHLLIKPYVQGYQLLPVGVPQIQNVSLDPH